MDNKKIREILEFNPKGESSITPISLLGGTEAYWVFDDAAVFDDKTNQPHAILASGKHSDGYFNISKALQFSNICEIFANMIKRAYCENVGVAIDAVVSSSYAALPLGAEVARQLDTMFFFTEKDGEGQKWSGRFELVDGMKLLHIEDVISTLSTAEKVHKAVADANPNVKFLEKDGKAIVLTIVHRPSVLADYPDYKIISLTEKEVHSWNPSECPLCKKDSKPLKPKTNWQIFQKVMEFQRFRDDIINRW
mgnify:CR=1 FL=1